MDPGAGLIRLALFGAPVARSLSPRIHALFAKQAAIPAAYEAIETPPGTLAKALARFADSGGAGCNITVPLKTEAMDLAANCSAGVRLAGAANTLTIDAGGAWRADNTDGAGLVGDLSREMGIEGRSLAIGGAGGAAAGVLAALLEQQPAGVTLINRNRDKAAELAQRHAGLGTIKVLDWNTANRQGRHDLFINATSLGHAGQLPPIEAGLFDACYDLNYGAAAEPLRNWCSGHGIPYRDGLGMLVEQAAESFRIWTGFSPDTRPVLEELRAQQQ